MRLQMERQDGRLEMNSVVIKYSCILLFGVFISAISQVMLKKAALKKYDSVIKEY